MKTFLINLFCPFAGIESRVMANIARMDVTIARTQETIRATRLVLDKVAK